MFKMAETRDLPICGILFVICFLSVSPNLVVSTGELSVLHKPNSVRLHQTSDKINPGNIQKLIASSFGLATKEWRGLLSKSLFSSPKANILVTIPGYSTRIKPLTVTSVAKYALSDEAPYVDVSQLKWQMEEDFVEQRPLIVDLSLDKSVVLLESRHAEIFDGLPSSLSQMESRLTQDGSILYRHNARSLNASRRSDLTLLTELQLASDVCRTMTRHRDRIQSNSPDFYSFTISSLENLVEQEGAESQKVKDAVALISAVLSDLKTCFVELYKGNVMVEVVTIATGVSEPKMRIARSLKEEKTPKQPKPDMGIADDYHRNYPVIFNIILWLMIALVLATFIIAHSIWTMDPGRDSIIYRMTSQRMKKDN